MGPVFDAEIEWLESFDSYLHLGLALQDRNVKGVARSPHCCVLAELLKPHLAASGLRIMVDVGSIEVTDAAVNVQVWACHTTPAMTELIEAFDNHEFPDLETPGSRCHESSCERCNPPTAVAP